MKDIKRTPNFTAFIANATGMGRVGRHSIAKGKTAIVPESMKFEEPEEEKDESRNRSFVSDAGVFDGSKRGRMFK